MERVIGIIGIAAAAALFLGVFILVCLFLAWTAIAGRDPEKAGEILRRWLEALK